MKESRGITPLRTILQNCLNHIENLETNRTITDNYDKEFQDLKQFSEALKTQKEYSCTEGEKEVNRKKNRYKDILPFNISRVVLSEYAGIPGSDYINANYIKGASGSPAYIASQGPLPNTVNDFWRMVVECEVQVIVMACNAQESGKHKCENYWVEKEGEEKTFGMVQICLVKASTVCPDFLVRTMRLKYTNDKDVREERTVCQFHYSAWPDHGVPPLVRPLLDMVRLVRDTQASETLPVLVHCSAGCGRTGTICAIDFVWGLLRAGKLTEEFSLFNLVKDMRKQRVAMVQTKEQYILVHQAVRELFKEQIRVIESHPYENIDFNGVPLSKDFEEPFYDTISIEKEENCDALTMSTAGEVDETLAKKQDKSEMKEKEENVDGRINKMDAAPPLPRKKRPNVLFSKQEKEAENLTEKNRSSFAEKEREKEKEKMDASLSSLLGKPRIVKLRALFEKSQTAKERVGVKERGSQTVSRSHSLGAARKPILTEIYDSHAEKNKPSTAPSVLASDSGKLKHSKSFSRSVPLIKRSKSLKTFKQSSHLIVSPAGTVILKNYQQKPYDGENHASEKVRKAPTTTCDIVETSELAKECSKRRRSLESLMGDVPPSVNWQRIVEQSSLDLKSRQKSLDWSPKLNSTAVQTHKAADMLKHQFQKLSLETERKINTFVSGIGIRERRNSFRQAVNKSDFQTKKSLNENLEGTHRSGAHLNRNQTTDQLDGVYEHSVTKNVTEGKKHKFHEKLSDGMKKMSLPAQQNSMACGRVVVDSLAPKNILTTKTRIEEPESKNLFLKKLNSEIYESQREDHMQHETRSRPGHEDSDKKLRYNPILVRSDSKKTLFRTHISVKPTGSHTNPEINSRSPEGETEKLFKPSVRQNYSFHPFQKPPQTYDVYKCYATSPSTPYVRSNPVQKCLAYQNSLGDGNPSPDLRQKDQLFSSHKKSPVPLKVQENEVTFNSYRKNHTSNSDLYMTVGPELDGSDKKLALPPKRTVVGKISKTYDHVPWAHPGSSRPFGDVSSSEHSLDSSRLCQFETENPVKLEVKVIKKPEPVRIRLGEPSKVVPHNEQSTSQKGVEEPKTNTSAELCNYGVFGTSKSRSNMSEYSKDDFLVKEPTAPPRVKRHASVTVPRNVLNGLESTPAWVATESKSAGVRSATLQVDKNAWNGTIGVDLDAVAASMQQDKKDLSSVLKDGVWSGKSHLNTSANLNVKKKQHYL